MRRITLLLPCLLLAACSVQQKPIRTLQAVIPAAGVTALDMQVNIGKVAITSSSDSQIHVSVSLQPSSNFFGLFTDTDSVKAARGAAISHALDAGVLKLGMQYPANADSSGISEHWIVAIPANLHVTGHVNVGEIQVTGISGGVDSNINVGKVVLDLPSGTIKASVNVGKIDALAHSLNYGKITVGADVGHAELKVNGAAAGVMQKTGAGNDVSYQGHGQDVISLTVNTGKIVLNLDGK